MNSRERNRAIKRDIKRRAAKKRRVALQPSDLHAHGPWVAGCRVCKDLREQNEIGFVMYILAVAAHFDQDHDIVLVGGA